MTRKKIAEFDPPDGDKGAKVYRDSEWNEYRVVFYRSTVKQEGADYHTSDRQDALDTAASFVHTK